MSAPRPSSPDGIPQEAVALFPGPLLDCYRAVVAEVTAEGDVAIEFKKTQVSFGLERKFAWLLPLTRRRCLLVLDMYQEHSSPVFRGVIRYRDDKVTHQAEVATPDQVRQVAAEGWFGLARDWGAKACG